MSPEAAAQLLAQYTQQQIRKQLKKELMGYNRWQNQERFHSDVAASLTKLQSQNVPANEYAAALDALVAGGNRATPAAAARLAEQYRRQRAEVRA